MCLFVCFEAGRFTQTQSSRTVVCRSRKWMSGHAGYAAALAQFQTDPFRQITATVTPSTSTLREILPLGPGRGVFSLDKSLSWRSHGHPMLVRKPLGNPQEVIVDLQGGPHTRMVAHQTSGLLMWEFAVKLSSKNDSRIAKMVACV